MPVGGRKTHIHLVISGMRLFGADPESSGPRLDSGSLARVRAPE
jgi:hypothetical protein